MDGLLKIAGDAAAAVGVLICLAAGLARLAGSYHLLGYEALTLFTGGIALMVVACLAKLHRLERPGGR